VFRFFKDLSWRYVIIDKRIPVYNSAGDYIYGKCAVPEELWVPLIEKAYAKLFGCYYSLIGGFIDEALEDLTSMVPEKKTLHDRNGHFHEDPEEFWQFLMSCKRHHCLMGCSRKA
jgi:hypothetical protein